MVLVEDLLRVEVGQIRGGFVAAEFDLEIGAEYDLVLLEVHHAEGFEQKQVQLRTLVGLNQVILLVLDVQGHQQRGVFRHGHLLYLLELYAPHQAVVLVLLENVDVVVGNQDCQPLAVALAVDAEYPVAEAAQTYRAVVVALRLYELHNARVLANVELVLGEQASFRRSAGSFTA